MRRFGPFAENMLVMECAGRRGSFALLHFRSQPVLEVIQRSWGLWFQGNAAMRRPGPFAKIAVERSGSRRGSCAPLHFYSQPVPVAIQRS